MSYGSSIYHECDVEIALTCNLSVFFLEATHMLPQNFKTKAWLLLSLLKQDLDITFGLQTISDFFPYCIYMQLSNITLEH